MSKLSLATRKNIKDYEPKLQENLKKITAASGIAFEAEFDFLTLAPAAEEKGYKDRIGDLIQDSYMSALVKNVEKFCTDSVQKASFVEAFGEKKRITLILADAVGEWGYVGTKNDNGTLTIVVPKERFISNVDHTGQDLSKACSAGSGAMTVATRKNIQDNEENRKKNLDRIQKATGLAFELVIDWPLFAEVAAGRGYADCVGGLMLSSYLEPLAANLERLCKDDMTNEAIVEACAKKTITFKIVPNSELNGAYAKTSFDDGVLTINLSKERYCSNVDHCGKDIESCL